MGNLLAVLAGVFLIVVLSSLLAAKLFLRSLRRRLRIHPKVRTDAPLRWLWVPSAGATLHRRLQSCVAIVRATTVRSDLSGWVGSEFPALIAEIETEAVRISHQLCAASRQPKGAKARVYDYVDDRVTTLETTVNRLVETAADWSSCTTVITPLGRVDDRLDALRAAAHEVARADDPDWVARPPRPARPARSVNASRSRTR